MFHLSPQELSETEVLTLIYSYSLFPIIKNFNLTCLNYLIFDYDALKAQIQIVFFLACKFQCKVKCIFILCWITLVANSKYQVYVRYMSGSYVIYVLGGPAKAYVEPQRHPGVFIGKGKDEVLCTEKSFAKRLMLIPISCPR